MNNLYIQLCLIIYIVGEMKFPLAFALVHSLLSNKKKGCHLIMTKKGADAMVNSLNKTKDMVKIKATNESVHSIEAKSGYQQGLLKIVVVHSIHGFTIEQLYKLSEDVIKNWLQDNWGISASIKNWNMLQQQPFKTISFYRCYSVVLSIESETANEKNTEVDSLTIENPIILNRINNLIWSHIMISKEIDKFFTGICKSWMPERNIFWGNEENVKMSICAVIEEVVKRDVDKDTDIAQLVEVYKRYFNTDNFLTRLVYAALVFV
ncbi:MAG: hypothetical protein Q8Q60_05640 [Candidatus Chromulinivorax sp.]|nr:hypothetical protein [Candidatus Chromulinivorax sp.]